MKQPLLWLGLGAVVALALSKTSKGAKSPETPEPIVTSGCPATSSRVLLVGDSLAGGLAPPMAELARACNTPFESDAFISAHVTEWAGARIGAALERFKPSHVLFSLGGNDFQRTDPLLVHSAIEQFVWQIRVFGALPLWIEPPVMPREDEQVRQWWAESGATYYDLRTVAELQPHRAADQIHYTPAGYKLMADILWRWASKWVISPAPAAQ